MGDSGRIAYLGPPPFLHDEDHDQYIDDDLDHDLSDAFLDVDFDNEPDHESDNDFVEDPEEESEGDGEEFKLDWLASQLYGTSADPETQRKSTKQIRYYLATGVDDTYDLPFKLFWDLDTALFHNALLGGMYVCWELMEEIDPVVFRRATSPAFSTDRIKIALHYNLDWSRFPVNWMTWTLAHRILTHGSSSSADPQRTKVMARTS